MSELEEDAVWNTHSVHDFIRTVASDVRMRTEHEFPEALNLWRDGITLRFATFLPGSTTTIVGLDDSTESQVWGLAFEYRMSQSIATIATANLTMDAILSGYYAQSLAICRTLLEAWKRTAFVRRRPNEVGRWMDSKWILDTLGSDIDSPKSGPQPKPTEWDLVFPASDWASPQDEQDRIILELLNKHVEKLHAFVHPNFEGYAQHLGSIRKNVNPLPPFNRQYADQALHLANVAEFAWIAELPMLVQVSDDWTTQVIDWRSRFKQMYEQKH